MIYLSDKQVAARYAVDRAAIWRWCKVEPDFPGPVKLTPERHAGVSPTSNLGN
ncbi:helix-turn-helix transcriptional regulator [Yoonia algicola]|uniref:DNA-binding protein n=1 Tax=Yoonia algicola TaxID=3137368 RepID=A0AAN0NH37_9RHOB